MDLEILNPSLVLVLAAQTHSTPLISYFFINEKHKKINLSFLLNLKDYWIKYIKHSLYRICGVGLVSHIVKISQGESVHGVKVVRVCGFTLINCHLQRSYVTDLFEAKDDYHPY